MVADPRGRFLYALNLGASSFGMQFGQIGIAGYQIDRASGRLIPAPGQIIFLGDCTHSLAGQIVDIPPFSWTDDSDE